MAHHLGRGGLGLGFRVGGGGDGGRGHTQEEHHQRRVIREDGKLEIHWERRLSPGDATDVSGFCISDAGSHLGGEGGGLAGGRGGGGGLEEHIIGGAEGKQLSAQQPPQSNRSTCNDSRGRAPR